MKTTVLIAVSFLFLVLNACSPIPSGLGGDNSNKTIIVDVRTPEEWNLDGHAECSVNYPLGEVFNLKIDELKTYAKVQVVCRSGNRAGSAMEMLERSGYSSVENKGSWQSIDCNK